MALDQITPEILSLIDFLKKAGYPSIAARMEATASLATEVRKKAVLGLATENERKFLEVQEKLEDGLRSIGWLRQ